MTMLEKDYQDLVAQLGELKRLILAGTKEVLSIEECSVITDLSVNHLYRLTSQRAIPFYKPQGGKIYFRKREVEDWLLRNRHATEAEIRSEATTYCTIKQK